MGYVEVTCQYNWLRLLQHLQVLHEVNIPLLSAIVYSLQLLTCIWDIGCYHKEVNVFSCEDATLLVMFTYLNVV